jgi:hypothetical protein
MSEPISGILVEYGIDGDYLSPPIVLPANVVFDEVHGWVIELILPHSTANAESAVLLPLVQLEKLRGPLTDRIKVA